jgi:hypothetical protein
MRDGYVYFVRAVSGGPVKIGWALDPSDRLRALQANSPQKLELLVAYPATIEEERRLHREYAYARLHGEWFAYRSTLQRRVRNLRRTWGIPQAGILLPESLLRAARETPVIHGGVK